MRLMDIMIMRATQKKRMSRPVSSSAPGKKRCRSSPPVGQPKTEKGKRPLENQVSSTSSSCKGAQQSIPGSTSWISCGFWTLHCTHAAGVWTAPWVLHAMLAPPYLNACAVVSVSRIPHAGAQGLPAAMLQRTRCRRCPHLLERQLAPGKSTLCLRVRRGFVLRHDPPAAELVLVKKHARSRPRLSRS